MKILVNTILKLSVPYNRNLRKCWCMRGKKKFKKNQNIIVNFLFVVGGRKVDSENRFLQELKFLIYETRIIIAT